MFPPIFQVVAASPSVTALLGNSPVRFLPFAYADDGTELPYAVWSIVAGNPENYIGQLPDADSYSLQIDVYAATGASVRNVAKALRDAIEPHAHIVGWRGESRDRDTKTFRLSFDIDWLDQR